MNPLTADPSPSLQSLQVTSQYCSTPSDVSPETQSSVLNTSADTSSFDNDVSDLLRDHFGNIPGHSDYDGYISQEELKFIDELDQNLPLLAEILDDLQRAVKSENDNTVKKEPKIHERSAKTTIDPAQSITDIQNEIAFKIELDRVERLRKPKFQTMPAYEKRAKQEVQWKAAMRAARRASSLHSTTPYQHPVKYSGGSNNLHTVVMPILTTDPVDTSTSLDLSSLDIYVSNSSTSKSKPLLPSRPVSSTIHHPALQQVQIVKSNLMATTKKHLSAANHFPANSRIFNRSLQQLQSQAEAISSAYLSASARSVSLPRVNSQKDSHPGKVPDQPSGNVLNKTTNITRFLKDVNNNPVSSPVNTKHSVNNASGFLGNRNVVPIQKYYISSDPVSNNNSAFQTVVKTNHLPVYSLPLHPVRTPQVLHPIQLSSNTSSAQRYLLVDIPSPANSVIQKITSLSQSKVPPILPPRARPTKKAPPRLPSIPSCYNCQKLARVLPYLAHSRRKLVMSCTSVSETAMVLLCEVCGAAVRETVIFGDHIVLDHVASAHFPFFLVNRPLHGLGQEESQNNISLGEEWG